MQLVTPSVVAMVVSMAIANCTMVFQISFFFILHIKFRISELRISQMSRRLNSEHVIAQRFACKELSII